jgi:ABC-type branched-subunit amino acid transport system ATPase component
MNPEEARALSGLIREIHGKFSLTVMLIEHHMDVVMRLCSRILVMNFGAVIAQGRPEEVRRDERVLSAYLGRRA